MRVVAVYSILHTVACVVSIPLRTKSFLGILAAQKLGREQKEGDGEGAGKEG